MKENKNYSIYIIILIILTGSILLKIFYRLLPVDHFKIFLYPVALLVSFSNGISFHFEPHSGYINSEELVTIGKICSGINFFIMLNLLSIYLFLFLKTDFHKYLVILALSVLTNFIITVIANTIRIQSAIYLFNLFPNIINDPFRKEWTHYIMGTFIFLFSFITYFLIIQRTKVWIQKTADQK